MGDKVDQHCLNTLILKARTQNGWLDRPVTDEQLRQIYDILKQGPTSANTCPARILFLRTPEAKARLLPALAPGNVDKTKAAPVTAIIGYDTRFFEFMPAKLFAHRPEMADNYAKNPPFAEITAFRNARCRVPTSCWQRAPSASTSGDVGLRQRQGRSRVLPRRAREVELPLQRRLRGSSEGDAEAAAPRFRGSVPSALT